MKRNLGYAVLTAILCAIFAVPAFSQSATVKGVCKDLDGNPIADATVTWHNQDNGRSFTVKTNNKGEYLRLGLDSGKYTITLTKDGKELDSIKDLHLALEERVLDFDLRQAQADAAKQNGMTADQAKQKQAANSDAEKYNADVKKVNDRFAAATAATQLTPPDYDKAIALLSEAVTLVPNENLVWYRRGTVYLDSAKTQTDPAEKTQRYTNAYNDFQKAIDLKKNAMATQPPKPVPPGGVTDKVLLANYYENMAAAAARVGKDDEAMSAYQQAADLDPANAGHYYLNTGILITNSNKTGDPEIVKKAVEAFDKAIAADPKTADAYYWKGTDLMGLLKMDSNNKVIAPPGMADAFQKYLELEPDGRYAAEAKNGLSLVGSTVETNYGTKKKK